jgi:hypothetical protein
LRFFNFLLCSLILISGFTGHTSTQAQDRP